MGKIGNIPSVVPSIPISMVTGLSTALANAGKVIKYKTKTEWEAITVSTGDRLVPSGVISAMVNISGNVVFTVLGDGIKDFFALNRNYFYNKVGVFSPILAFDTFEVVTFEQVTNINFTLDTANSYDGTSKTIFLKTNVNAVLFSNDFIEMDGSLSIIKNIENVIYLEYYNGKVYYSINKRVGSVVTNNNPPVASNLTVTGNTYVYEQLTANYSYSDNENDLELATIIRWYSSDINGADVQLIKTSSESDKNYFITPNDTTRLIYVEVTPYASTGSQKGNKITSNSTISIPTFFLQTVSFKTVAAALSVLNNTVTRITSGGLPLAKTAHAFNTYLYSWCEFKIVGTSAFIYFRDGTNTYGALVNTNGSGQRNVNTVLTTITGVAFGVNCLYRFIFSGGSLLFQSCVAGDRLVWVTHSTIITGITTGTFYVDISPGAVNDKVTNLLMGSASPIIINPL